MKNLKELIVSEGLLAGMDNTMQVGDDLAKKMKEVESIKKNLFLLNILWHKGFGCSNDNTDFFGISIKTGDAVLFNIEDTEDWSFGIVVEEPNRFGDNCKIIVGEARIKGKDENDPYNDCISYYAPSKNIIVLARAKKSKQLLQIIESVA